MQGRGRGNNCVRVAVAPPGGSPVYFISPDQIHHLWLCLSYHRSHWTPTNPARRDTWGALRHDSTKAQSAIIEIYQPLNEGDTEILTDQLVLIRSSHSVHLQARPERRNRQLNLNELNSYSPIVKQERKRMWLRTHSAVVLFLGVLSFQLPEEESTFHNYTHIKYAFKYGFRDFIWLLLASAIKILCV